MQLTCSLVLRIGTGKTATVLASINQLRTEVAAGKLNEFSFIEINCLRLKSPYDACKGLC
jgi:Cdc6-like AAA superfamily ATPase